MSKSISFRPVPLTELLVDNDPGRVIRVDLTDPGVLARYEAALPVMDECIAKFRSISEHDNTDYSAIAATITEADKKLAECINGIFNADVCGPAANGASLFTLVDGYMLCECILTVMSDLYEGELKNQVALRQKRIKKHTTKYGK